jgi:hypothetical protein
MTGGANTYKDNISGVNCLGLTVGDSLQTEPGNMVGPTICGAWPGAQGCGGTSGPGQCSMIRGDKADPLSTAQSDTTYGDCGDSGGVGVDIIAAFTDVSQVAALIDGRVMLGLHAQKVFQTIRREGRTHSFDQAKS